MMTGRLGGRTFSPLSFPPSSALKGRTLPPGYRREVRPLANGRVGGWMKWVVVALLVGVTGGEVWGQPVDTLWTKTYPGRNMWTTGDRLIRTTDGGFAIGGNYNNGNDWDYILIKTDSTGTMQWYRVYASHLNEYPGLINRVDLLYGLAMDSIGEFYLAGLWSYYQASFLLKVNTEGDTIWGKRYGEDSGNEFYDVTISRDGCPVTAGVSSEFAEHGSWDASLVKFDTSGTEIWRGAYGGRSGDSFSRVIATSNGGYLAVGETTSFGGLKGYVVKVDSVGNEEWSRACYSNDEEHTLRAAVEVPDGGYLVGGNGNINGDINFFCARLTADGDTLWTRKWGSARRNGHDDIYDIAIAPGGGFLIVGDNFDLGYAAQRFNENGFTIWRMDFGDHMPDYFTAALPLEDGSYAIAGQKNVVDVALQAWLVRTTPDPAFNSVSLLDPAFPSRFTFSPPFPNPFNSSTTISFGLDKSTPTRLAIYDAAGREVALVAEGLQPAGSHSMTWNAGGVPAGEYFVRLQAGGAVGVRRVVLVR